MLKIKKHLFFLLVFFCSRTPDIEAQNSIPKKLKTYSLGGKFSFGFNIEKGATGLVYVYPESDSTVLFFIDVNRGAPSYNMGNLYGRLNVKSGKGSFVKYLAGEKKSCELEFKFQNESLKISTVEGNNYCGFGYGVFADGIYKRKSRSIPEYFINMKGEKRFFKETNPDTWEND